jgi:hypothetical protein
MAFKNDGLKIVDRYFQDRGRTLKNFILKLIHGGTNLRIKFITIKLSKKTSFLIKKLVQNYSNTV